MDHYRPDDRIYLLGFSRGALAVRLVGGLLHRFGVLRSGAKNLIPYALELYEQHYTHITDPSQLRQARELNEEFRTLFCMPGGVRIRFLGVWDTSSGTGRSPKRPLTWWPTSGRRDVNAFRREGPLLLHRSVEPYFRAGRYHIKDVAFVDDSPYVSAL